MSECQCVVYNSEMHGFVPIPKKDFGFPIQPCRPTNTNEGDESSIGICDLTQVREPVQRFTDIPKIESNQEEHLLSMTFFYFSVKGGMRFLSDWKNLIKFFI